MINLILSPAIGRDPRVCLNVSTRYVVPLTTSYFDVTKFVTLNYRNDSGLIFLYKPSFTAVGFKIPSFLNFALRSDYFHMVLGK